MAKEERKNKSAESNQQEIKKKMNQEKNNLFSFDFTC
jgi:hypothetical protein